MHSEEFNHHPGQLQMQCGVSRFGMPTMGSWISYGLGSQSSNLPGYVVLNAGRGSSGGATLWQSGFLPSTYSAVLFSYNRGTSSEFGQPQGTSILPATKRSLHPPYYQPRPFLRKFTTPKSPPGLPLMNWPTEQVSAPELNDLSKESTATLKPMG